MAICLTSTLRLLLSLCAALEIGPLNLRPSTLPSVGLLAQEPVPDSRCDNTAPFGLGRSINIPEYGVGLQHCHIVVGSL